MRLSKLKQLFYNQTVLLTVVDATHNERRFQFRFLNHLFRMVPGFMGKLGSIAGDRRQNVNPKFAQVPEQSELTYSVDLVAAAVETGTAA